MNQITNMLASIIALLVGGIIGAAFGMVQNAARRKNEERQKKGDLNNGWSVMPGSGARVAYFLVALLLIQLICPLLFRDGTQWWVTGGVGVGYGVMLVLQLRQRLLGHK
jgi:H+/gluconate symporter-like permease